jgi:hypothetical protein
LAAALMDNLNNKKEKEKKENNNNNNIPTDRRGEYSLFVSIIIVAYFLIESHILLSLMFMLKPK